MCTITMVTIWAIAVVSQWYASVMKIVSCWCTYVDRSAPGLEFVWPRVFVFTIGPFEYERNCSRSVARRYVGILQPSSGCHLCHNARTQHPVLPPRWFEAVQTGITRIYSIAVG